MSPLPKTPSDLAKSLRRLSGRDILLILTAVPIIFLFLAAPQTFELSWAGFGKLGRGGLAFVLFFLGFDLLDYKKAKIQWTSIRKVATVLTVSAATIYFIEVGLGQDVTNFIYSIGRSLGASGDVSNSFLMATDYIAMSIYLTLLTTVLFSLNAIRRVITPIVFSLGMLFFYMLDAFFPYGSLGPLQFWADFIVAGVAFLAKIFGLPIYGFTNHLTIEGLHGYYRLVVYWPSVGVQSILIYSVVMLVIAAKLQAPLIRKVIYAAVGIGGTVLLNVLRIFTISYYGYVYATSGQQLDAFHNAIGEVLFPIWIVVFLVLILEIEDKLAPARKSGHGKKPKKEQSRGARRKVKAGGR
jgi:thaumarchaeosortase